MKTHRMDAEVTQRLTKVKLYVVEIVGTVVFVVFICVEGVLAIRHLLAMLK